MTPRLGFVAFFYLWGLNTTTCLETWVLVDIDGALKVVEFFAIGFRIDSLSKSKFIPAKVLPKML